MRKAFVAGFPIRHSRSPIIHRYWLKRYGLAGSYDPVDVSIEGFPQFLSGLSGAGFVGGNVTIPHKEAACWLADEVDDTAGRLGAANTLWLEEGRLRATNTDAAGFAANLDAHHPGWDREAVAVVLGAGGAARAVVHALIERGFDDVRVVNRTVRRAADVAACFGDRVSPHPAEALQESLSGAGLFVNTTSLGMDGAPVPEIDFSPMRDGACVTDIVYVPLETPILNMAREQGRPTVDGLDMLLHQATPGFEKWFGVRPEVTPELRQLIEADLGVARHNAGIKASS